MTNKVRFHIPIHTPEQMVVRDEIARQLMKDYDAVILHLEYSIKLIKGKTVSFPISIVEIYTGDITEELLEYFKELTMIIAKEIKGSVVLEVTRESIYTGTSGGE